MYVLTNHFTLLAINQTDNLLTQVRSLSPPGGEMLIDIDEAQAGWMETELLRSGAPGVTITSGPLAGYSFMRSVFPDRFHLFKGQFARVTPEMGPVACDAEVAGEWESFSFASAETAEFHLRVHHQDEAAFAARVRALIDQQAPVCLHFGCGQRRIDGFLNIDKYVNFGDPTDYYVCDIIEKPWPVPDACVDYIYSEDFIEHIPQRSQVGFLAEAFRVLKPDRFHRVNTPCLAESLKVHSDFTKGFRGVYFDEFDHWGHVSIFTRGMMQDLAHAIGYKQVFFTAKSRGSSPYAVPDRRPGGDRDDHTGNIYADLLK